VKVFTIGPKYYRSALPVGKVTESVLEKVLLAEQGRLGTQLYYFNLRTSKEVKVPGGTQAEYQKVYVMNGHCRYKRYTVLDLVAYRFFQLFGQRSKGQQTSGR